MTLPKIDDDTLRHILSENLTPSRTIRTPERLFGREKNLVTIERAFNSPGRQVFIYGDRGVGKSSLALTAGYLNASVESGDPIYLVCDKNSTFSEIIRSVGQGTASVTSRMEVPGKSASLTGSIAGFGGGFQPGSRSAAAIPEPSNLNEALDIIKYVGHKRNGRTVVIIDEMERLSKKDEKDKFAEFIKNIPEIDCDVRFIFCGIGSELDELLGEHPSAGRILETIKLGGLRYDSLWQIITATADKLGVDVEREILIRVGQISDGFPHYVHLIGETMFGACSTKRRTWSAVITLTLGQGSREHYREQRRLSVRSMIGRHRKPRILKITKRHSGLSRTSALIGAK